MKKLLLLISVATLYFSFSYGQTGAVSEITWTVENDTLTISGEGEMSEYESPNDYPWSDYYIKYVVIEEGVTNIGDYAFWNYQNLLTVDIPASVNRIGKETIIYCFNLTSINVDSDNKSYSSADGVLYNKDKSVLIMYPAGKVADSFSIPASVKTIGEHAFDDAGKLISVNIPESVTSIGAYAFSWSGLVSVTILSSVTSIGTQAFSSCSNLRSITVDPYNAYYTSVDGILYSKDKKILYTYPAGKSDKNFNIPNGVETITVNSFSSDKLTSVTLPNTLLKIESLAFQLCTGLDSIIIPKSVTMIETQAFRLCNNLKYVKVDPANAGYASEDGVLYNKNKTVMLAYPAMKIDTEFTVPLSVKNISWAFDSSNDNLLSLTVPATVTEIRGLLLLSNLTSFTSYHKKPLAVSSIFGYINKEDCTLRIPEGSLQAYSESPVWNRFENIIEFPVNNIKVDESATVTNSSTGNFELSFTMPSDITFEGSYKLKLPEGMKLNTVSSRLSAEAAVNHTLQFNYDQNKELWTVTVAAKSAASSIEDNYDRIMNISFSIDESVENGEYIIELQNMDFTLSDGAKVEEDKIEVVVNFKRIDAGNEAIESRFKVVFNNGELMVNTPVSEQIYVYSIAGNRIFSTNKPAGQATFNIPVNDRIVIVRGSSGWSRKVAY